MPVSYLSQTYKPNPYIAPVSLDLLAKVLSTKQTQFDQKAEQIQSNINSVAALDVARGVDKDYLNSKLNGIVNSINSVGGADLSDANVSNQLNGLATSVYNDQNVLAAVSSTKRIRSLQGSYDKMKTDPKLAKYWSDANYVNDMESVNSYMGSKDLGASYQGNSAATPFHDYDKEYRDIFTKMTPSEYIFNEKTGYYLDKKSNIEVSPETVMQAARERMSSNARGQMERDANYLYKYKAGYGKADIVAKVVNDQATDLQITQAEYDRLHNASIIEQDHTKKTNLLTQADAQKALVDQKKAQLQTAIQDNSKLYDSNPKEAMYKAYSNDYIKGLARTYSYRKTNITRTADPVEKMFFEAKEKRYNTQSTIDAAKGLQDLKGAQAMRLKEMDLVGDGKGEFDAQGRFKFKKSADDLSSPQFKGTSPNTIDKDVDAAIEVANTKILQLEDESTQEWTKFAQKIYADAGVPFELGKADTNGDGKITGEDYANWIDINNKLIVGKGANTDKEYKLLVQLSQAHDAFAKGNLGNITSFPQGTAEMMETLKFNALERDHLKNNIDDYKNSGKNKFIVKNFQDRLFSMDDKTQGSKSMGYLKSYLSKNFDIPAANYDVLSLTKSQDGSYDIVYQYKDKDQKLIKSQPLKVPVAVAIAMNEPEDRSQILNDVITYDKPQEFTIQNRSNKDFVGSIKVYATSSGLNSQKYKVGYYMDGRFVPVNMSRIDPSKSDEFETASQAYSTMKEILQSTPLSKQKFEEQLRKTTK